ncbi:MAG: plastocyanin/azurin family copper-binding protein [Marinobacter sp.]|uniref:plastocyanin/azurin family copper-binding protein n=1 Tax=Marinobacter sp. TaxID=50741 RepID=UPI00299F4588|nr:plastocyanin/azurin family copper-binding protein [Marinobacter sp.]MDX1757696.1 plastocyanin/azurin family copper-binding protein [Marinobacter sp.]
MRKLIVTLMLATMATGVAAETYTVGQQDKSFTEEQLTIKTGDNVEFENNDPFFHNVFSLSDTKFFDLGSYPKGESRTVEFTEPGIVEVECAIHPQMKMTIEVEE